MFMTRILAMIKDTKTTHDEQIARYFDKVAPTWSDIYSENSSRLKHWIDNIFRSDLFIEFQVIFQEISDLRAKTVLDIGCGCGNYCIAAVKQGCKRVVGIDISASMIKAAQTRAEKEGVGNICKFIRGSFPNESLNEVFDYCIAIGVMDYVRDPAGFLTAMRKHTRTKAVVSFPGRHWLHTPLRKMRYKLVRCPVYFFDRNQVKGLLITSGFVWTSIIKNPGIGADYLAILS
jgi:2-polyprenyl-3-methyl-5-hydroxy-6-metoxy-1,4-benzoquinol methylase